MLAFAAGGFLIGIVGLNVVEMTITGAAIPPRQLQGLALGGGLVGCGLLLQLLRDLLSGAGRDSGPPGPANPRWGLSFLLLMLAPLGVSVVLFVADLGKVIMFPLLTVAGGIGLGAWLALALRTRGQLRRSLAMLGATLGLALAVAAHGGVQGYFLARGTAVELSGMDEDESHVLRPGTPVRPAAPLVDKDLEDKLRALQDARSAPAAAD